MYFRLLHLTTMYMYMYVHIHTCTCMYMYTVHCTCTVHVHVNVLGIIRDIHTLYIYACTIGSNHAYSTRHL